MINDRVFHLKWLPQLTVYSALLLSAVVTVIGLVIYLLRAYVGVGGILEFKVHGHYVSEWICLICSVADVVVLAILVVARKHFAKDAPNIIDYFTNRMERS